MPETTSARVELFKTEVEQRISELGDLVSKVDECAKSVDKINALADQLDRTRDVKKRKALDAQLKDPLQRHLSVEDDVRSYLSRLQRTLSLIPIHPPSLREIRDEIESLPIWQGMTPSGHFIRPAQRDLPLLGVRLAELSDYPPRADEKAAPAFHLPEGTCWEDVEIRFLSDHRIHVRSRKTEQHLNYAEAGLEDGRNHNPKRAWELLREFAEQGGVISQALPDQDLSRQQKKVQELRKALRQLLNISEDPITFDRRERSYRTRFKVSFPRSDRL